MRRRLAPSADSASTVPSDAASAARTAGSVSVAKAVGEGGKLGAPLRRRDAHFRRGIGGDQAREVAGIGRQRRDPLHPLGGVGVLVQRGTGEYPGDHGGQ